MEYSDLSETLLVSVSKRVAELFSRSRGFQSRSDLLILVRPEQEAICVFTHCTLPKQKASVAKCAWGVLSVPYNPEMDSPWNHSRMSPNIFRDV